MQPHVIQKMADGAVPVEVRMLRRAPQAHDGDSFAPWKSGEDGAVWGAFGEKTSPVPVPWDTLSHGAVWGAFGEKTSPVPWDTLSAFDVAVAVKNGSVADITALVETLLTCDFQGAISDPTPTRLWASAAIVLQLGNEYLSQACSHLSRQLSVLDGECTLHKGEHQCLSGRIAELLVQKVGRHV